MISHTSNEEIRTKYLSHVELLKNTVSRIAAMDKSDRMSVYLTIVEAINTFGLILSTWQFYFKTPEMFARLSKEELDVLSVDLYCLLLNFTETDTGLEKVILDMTERGLVGAPTESKKDLSFIC